MSETEQLPPETISDLNGLWLSAVSRPVSAAQAPVLGFNLRLNLAKAFNAIAATATAFSSVAGAAALDPVSLLKLPASVFAAVSAGIAAVYEKMAAAHYVACLVLAKHEVGLAKQAFETELRDFLASAKGKTFPWYLGLTEQRLAETSDALDQANGFEDLIKGLKQKKYVEEKDGKFHYAVSNFQLGLFPD